MVERLMRAFCGAAWPDLVSGFSWLRARELFANEDRSRYIAGSRIIYAPDGYLQRLVCLLCAVAPQYFPVHAHGQKRQAFWGV